MTEAEMQKKIAAHDQEIHRARTDTALWCYWIAAIIIGLILTSFGVMEPGPGPGNGWSD